jgi:multidrug efflux pump subunit AcrA (membrane-fusion protein)
MSRILRIAGRLALVLIPLGLGLALLLQATGNREPLTIREVAEVVTTARVITIESVEFTPSISTFGSVEPVSVWRGVARVAGEVEFVHDDLQPGRLIEAGTEIVRIDATDYELAEAQARAGLASAEARLAELEMRAANLEASIAIERRSLAIGETDLERRRTLLERGTGSQIAVDQAEEAMLQRRARLQDLENQLKLIPVQRQVQEAEAVIAGGQLAEARRNIVHTRFKMPFDGRIQDVDVEPGQFAANGQVLVVAEDISEAEVTARLPILQVQPLVARPLDTLMGTDLTTSRLDAVPRDLGLSAELRLSVGGRTFAWPAAIRRMSFALEPTTRTIGLVVGVEEPYRRAVPGELPPLVKDLFVEIVVSGRRLDDALLVPREALSRSGDRGWSVHLADAEDRLVQRPVSIGGFFGNVALVGAGLDPGDRVVVSDLPFAIEGMKLAPREDDVLKTRLRRGQEAAVR